MIRTLFSRVRQYRWATIITPICMVGEVAMEVLIPTLMAMIIDNGVSSGDLAYIGRMSALLICSALLALLFGVLSARFGSYASAGFATNLRHDLFSKLQDLAFSDIDKFSTSSLITRLTTDVQNVQQTFMMTIRMMFRAPVMFIFAFFMVVRNGGLIASVYAISIPLVILSIFIIFRLTHKYFEAAFKGYDRFNMVVGENLNGIRAVKAYVREREETARFTKATDNIRANFVRGQKMMAITNPFVMAVSYACMIAVSYIGARLINVGTMETGQLMSIYTYTTQILSSLIMSGMLIIMFSISWPSMIRISEVLNYKPTMDRNEDGLKSVKDGSVEFKNVNFAYHEGGNVLKDINLKINSGEFIGVIGTTGSGKSTLISLIARLYDTTEGEVLVGGRNVKDYSLTSLRNAVAVVLQKNTLFSGTLEDNLRWGKADATEEEMREAADYASALSFIEESDDGFTHRVEQGGANYSGGQKQRLTIARALLKRPKILIMDDSTSAVDTATDIKIRESLNKKVNGMTKIIISQRISSVEEADRIVIMNNGMIEDIGTHAELLERNEGYKVLYETQTKGRKDA